MPRIAESDEQTGSAAAKNAGAEERFEALCRSSLAGHGVVEREQAFAEKRAQFFDLQGQLAEVSDDETRDELTTRIDETSEDLESLLSERLEQLEYVEASLRSVSADASATANNT